METLAKRSNTSDEKTVAVARSSQPTSFESPRLVETKLCPAASETPIPGNLVESGRESLSKSSNQSGKETGVFCDKKLGFPEFIATRNLNPSFRKIENWENEAPYATSIRVLKWLPSFSGAESFFKKKVHVSIRLSYGFCKITLNNL